MSLAYFAPYIDGTGLHMPTYEDRLADLVTAYRSIFGIDAELSESVPDYQLLSVFAKALDDVSALVLQAYNSRNPAYAAGAALDLLLPQYGITRAAGETDAEIRARIRTSLAGRSGGSADALLAAVKAVDYVWDAVLYVNDTDSTDGIGIPAHSLTAVVRGGAAEGIAQAIYDKKAPGIGTWGNTEANAVDAQGNTHPIRFTRNADKMVFADLYIRVLSGGDPTVIGNAVKPAVTDMINGLGLAVPLNVPQLFGVAYAAEPSLSGTFIINDIQMNAPGASGVIRDMIPCAWNERIATVLNGGVRIHFS